MNVSRPFKPSSHAEERLADLISSVGYGVIRNLRVEHGQPAFSSTTKVVRNIKFGTKDGHHTGLSSPKLHKGQMADLFAVIAEMGEGSIESIEIQAGLPFKMNVGYDCQL